MTNIWADYTFSELEQMDKDDISDILTLRGIDPMKPFDISSLWSPYLEDFLFREPYYWVQKTWEGQDVMVCKIEFSGKFAFYMSCDIGKNPSNIRLFYDIFDM